MVANSLSMVGTGENYSRLRQAKKNPDKNNRLEMAIIRKTRMSMHNLSSKVIT